MSFEEQLVNEINELRTNPKEYSEKVKKYVRYFAGKVLKIPGTKAGIRTEEGAAAYEEAADYLINFDTELKPLEPSKGLGRICADFLEKAKSVEPDEIRSIDLEGIIENYGSFSGSLNRAMDFGGEDPEQVIMNLLVCDGDPNRGNRESLLSPDFHKVGVAFAEHPTYGFCTLIISSTKFKNTYDSDDYGFIDSIKEEDTKPKKPEPKRAPEPYKRAPEPKKPTESYRNKPQEIEQNDDEEEEDIPREGVVSETRTEKIIMERGKKKRVIKIVRTMEDGSKETETIKENVDD